MKTKQRTHFFHRANRFWKSLGPGLISGASDDDPSAITTFSQAGASYGLATLWMALLAFPVSGRSAGNLRKDRHGDGEGTYRCREVELPILGCICFDRTDLPGISAEYRGGYRHIGGSR